MKKIYLVAIGVTASIVIMVLTIWSWRFFGPGGFIEGKAIFSQLQNLEVGHRHDRLHTPQVFATYDTVGPVVVVATLDRDFPYAWIAATIPFCDNELCMVGGGAHLDINCSDIAQLETQIRIAPPVLGMLRGSCRPG